jgi:hypothetical protein
MPEPRSTYTREEMDAILKRAIERQQAKSDGIGHEELVEAAGEVGIPREEVEAAARDLEAEKTARETPRESAELAAPDAGRRRAVRRFFRRAATFGVLTAFFFYLSGGQWEGWWIWPALGFGLSLTMTAIRILFGDDREERSERAREPRLSRQERRRLRRSEKLAEFEVKVTVGADALMRVIEETRRAKSRGPAAPESPPQRRVVVTPPPGVRVETEEARTRDDEGEDPARGGRSAKL